jgi:hypothetical protein
MKSMENVSNSVGVILKSIDYKSLSVKGKKDDENAVIVEDKCNIIEFTSSQITFLFSREINVQIDVGYKLVIEVEFKRFANEGVDLKEIFTEEEIKKDIRLFVSPVTNYVSLLVSQITSTFNHAPIVTPPSYIESK